jgi:SAM-dependent methyltransferase
MAVAQKRAEARTRYYARAEAQRVGWNVEHPALGGSFLEEQEIIDFFPDLRKALGSERPDFVSLLDGRPRLVIECKNDWQEIDQAVQEAREYADTINSIRRNDVHFAIGVAGTPDKRVQVRCDYKNGRGWVPLKSHDYPLTQLPMPVEVQTALDNNNGTTDVQLPDEREFFAAAINISRLLRVAKIEPPDRPKIIGAIILALYQGDFSFSPEIVIESINTNVGAALNKFKDVPRKRLEVLRDTLSLSTEADGLRPKVEDIVQQLERLNIRSIMRSGVDFLGQFYETFLRYGHDSAKLGIVFTPRHITRFCAELVKVELGQSVYDPACGTGGFLIASFDRMMKQATTPAARSKAKTSIFGFDTSATVWSLAMLNMAFRGDGKSNIERGNCFEDGKANIELFDRALLNPPFSQPGEPETQFIDHALAATKPGGRVAVVVKTSIMVDADLRKWRKVLVEEHHVDGVITLPADMFYPTAAPTVILLMRAHSPDAHRGTFLARIENDGFEISKKRRVPAEGSQLPNILELFRIYERRGIFDTVPNVAMVIPRSNILEGEEICAEQWLPSGNFTLADHEDGRIGTLRQISLAVANSPEIVDELIPDYEAQLSIGGQGDRPTQRTALSQWFDIRIAKSDGSSNYPPGPVPYISSGDLYNGVAAFVEPPEDETYSEPHITVSAFGQVYLQPWRFCARGNGGSAVRILTPKFTLTMPELFWFVGQINDQRWRFHYGRMAIGGRLGRLEVYPPPKTLPPLPPLGPKLQNFRHNLDTFMDSSSDSIAERLEDSHDTKIAKIRLKQIEADPDRLVSGAKLDKKLNELLS